ncbi:MAG: hypothetical protein IPK32_22205 [Verrucomicrobiaceae bacterium]|nr:hypothetical protein [Verrucomicrobiaceae bacterium]
MQPDVPLELKTQCDLSRRLALGFVGTFVAPFGPFAVFVGWRAMNQIEKSGCRLVGIRMAYWCFWVGLLQTLTLLPMIWLLFRWFYDADHPQPSNSEAL